MSLGAQRAIFIAAALFNLAIGLAMTIAPVAFGASAGIDYPPPAELPARSAGLLIAVFGIGYAFIAARPAANRDLMRLGIIGKLAFVALVAFGWLEGDVPTRAALLVSGDLVFAALFWLVLTRTATRE